jgi:hypothetical protein
VLGGAFGSRLGIIDISIKKSKNGWKVIRGTSLTRPIADDTGKPLVKKDKGLYKLLKPEHQETVDFIRKLGL